MALFRTTGVGRCIGKLVFRLSRSHVSLMGFSATVSHLSRPVVKRQLPTFLYPVSYTLRLIYLVSELCSPFPNTCTKSTGKVATCPYGNSSEALGDPATCTSSCSDILQL